MTQDLSNYTTDYYHRDAPEFWFGRHGLLRPDQLAAICYTFGVPFWGSEPYAPRQPGRVVSIGAGEGQLEGELERMLWPDNVVGVDPSLGAQRLYRGENLVAEANQTMIARAGTVIYAESVEHIPVEQTLQVRAWMSPGSRLIIVNWPDFHPIEASSDWDHITRVDDALYDRLAAGGATVLRRGSHLVVDVD